MESIGMYIAFIACGLLFIRLEYKMRALEAIVSSFQKEIISIDNKLDGIEGKLDLVVTYMKANSEISTQAKSQNERH